MRYDPDVTPDPARWLELDEQERVAEVKGYHKRTHVRLPNLQGHAIVHTAVENQLADGYVAAAGALDRLMKAGLDRHDAIHAVGSVLTRHLLKTLQGKQAFDTQAYDSELNGLTAETWKARATDD